MLLKVNKKATFNEDGIDKIQYFGVKWHPDKDGTIDVPKWAAADLIARGCTRLDGSSETIDMRAELASVPSTAPHEINIFLDAHGAHARYYEKNVHLMSDAERAKGNDAVADELDRLHQAYYTHVVKQPGQIFIPSFEEQKAHALELYDAMAAGSAKPVVPWSDAERLKRRVAKAKERAS